MARLRFSPQHTANQVDAGTYHNTYFEGCCPSRLFPFECLHNISQLQSNQGLIAIALNSHLIAWTMLVAFPIVCFLRTIPVVVISETKEAVPFQLLWEC